VETEISVQRVESAAGRRFVSRCRSLRLAKGWSQRELARRAVINGSYLAAVERGEFRITIELAEKVATCLGVDLAEMICKNPRTDDISVADEPLGAGKSRTSNKRRARRGT